MSTTATLDTPNLRLDPGGEVTIPVTIRNTGDVVEGYEIAVVGPPAAWATVQPPTVSLYPGASTTATISFHPPRAAGVAAGEMRYGVVVTPTEHPDEAVVPEGVLEVLPFLDTTAELIPRTSQSSRQGRHKVAVDNRGNVPVNVVLMAVDDGDLLKFRINNPSMTANTGEAVFSDVRVTPVKRLWRGSPITHPFMVVVTPQDSTAVELQGSYVQTAVIPKWLPKLLLALLALLLLLALLWFLVLKPTVTSAAEEAVADDVEKAEEQAAAAKEQAAAANESAGSAQQAAGQVEEASGKIDDVVGGIINPKVTTTVTPLAERLTAAPENGQDATDFFTVPEQQTVQITDIVLNNPQGDFGLVEVSIGGEPLFEMALENFRDIDYHFVTPLRADAGDDLSMRVQCVEAGRPPRQERPDGCDVAMFFGGEITQPVE
jgi:hypothetical protein